MLSSKPRQYRIPIDLERGEFKPLRTRLTTQAAEFTRGVADVERGSAANSNALCAGSNRAPMAMPYHSIKVARQNLERASAPTKIELQKRKRVGQRVREHQGPQVAA